MNPYLLVFLFALFGTMCIYIGFFVAGLMRAAKDDREDLAERNTKR